MRRTLRRLSRLAVVVSLFLALPAAKCAQEAKTVGADAAATALQCEAASPDPLSQATLDRCALLAGFSGAGDVLRLLQQSEAAHKALAARGYVVPPPGGGVP